MKYPIFTIHYFERTTIFLLWYKTFHVEILPNIRYNEISDYKCSKYMTEFPNVKIIK